MILRALAAVNRWNPFTTQGLVVSTVIDRQRSKGVRVKISRNPLAQVGQSLAGKSPTP
jgi:hypothetical protein